MLFINTFLLSTSISILAFGVALNALPLEDAFKSGSSPLLTLPLSVLNLFRTSLKLIYVLVAADGSISRVKRTRV